MYVESLIGPDTIATVPPDTLKQFEDHGRVSIALHPGAAEDARRVMNALDAGRIDLADVSRVLEEEGIEKFVASFDKLLGTIARKRRAMMRSTAEPGGSGPGSVAHSTAPIYEYTPRSRRRYGADS
jgi:hypothetical protein